MLEDGASQIKNYLEEMDYSPERLEESENACISCRIYVKIRR